MDEKLSVICPVFNAENSINSCIQSVLLSSYSNIELILIDDGSTDNSSNICDQYRELDERVLVIHSDNGGPAKARNAGLEIASGRYLAFIDADDTVEPDMYNMLINNLKKQGSQISICNWFIEDIQTGNTKLSTIGEPCVMESKTYRDTILEDNMKAGGGFLWNKVIDREAIFNNGKQVLFRTGLSVYEDKIWLLEIVPFVSHVSLITYAGYHYHVSATSLSHHNTSDRNINAVQACKTIYEIYATQEKKREIPATIKEILDNRARLAVWGLFRKREYKAVYDAMSQLPHLYNAEYRKQSWKCEIKSFLLNACTEIYRISGISKNMAQRR